MPAVVWSLDRQLRFTSSLGGGLSRLGLEPNEVVGMRLQEYMAADPDTLETQLHYHRQALDGESVRFRTNWLGNVYECHLSPLHDAGGAIIGVIGVAFDITNRERAEQQLIENEQRWESIFQHAIDPIWEWDMVADRATWSPSWARLLGYAPETFDPGEVTWESVLHPADRPHLLALLHRYLRGEVNDYIAEYRVRTKDGEWKWVLGRGVITTWDDDGRPTRMVGCIVDMTERRKLEQALRDRVAAESLVAAISSQFVNVASDQLDDAINSALKRLGMFADADRAYVFLLSEDGKTFSNTHEWCAEGIEPQKHTLENLSVDEFPWWMNQIRELKPIYIADVDALPAEATQERVSLQAQSTRSVLAMPMHFLGKLRGFVGYDGVRLGADGRIKQWSEDDASVLSAMGSVFISAIERRRAETSIRESQRFLSTLLSNLPGWVYRCRNDRNWTLEYASDGIRDVLGYEPDAFAGSGSNRFNDLIHPDDRKSVWRDVQSAVADDEPFQLVYRAYGADGEEKWLWEQGRAVKDEVGRVLFIEGFISDITERKRAEDELRRQEREFHAIVKNTPDIISRFDRNLRHVYVNPVVEQLTGHSPRSLLDIHVSELPWPQSLRDKWRDAIKTVFREELEKVIEVELDGPNGRLHLETRLVPEFDKEGRIDSVLAISRNVTMRKRAELGLLRANETQRLLLRELDHRVRNNLASLAALIDISGRNATSITEFADSIRGRVQAMTAVHGLLSKGHWSSVSLNDLLESLIPSDLFSHFDLQGPDVLVCANQCTALGMVVQELIANSLKYGALRTSTGRIQVHWTSDDAEGAPVTVLHLHWSERGGPTVESVNKPGLGSNLIQGLVRTELRGTASMEYPPEGAVHDFHLELDRDEDA